MPTIELKNINPKEIIPGYNVRFVHSENITLAYWEIKAGSPLPEHSHPNEQIANMIEGEYEITVDGETQILKPNSVVIIPSNAKHSGKALTDCKIIDVFYPIREDYR